MNLIGSVYIQSQMSHLPLKLERHNNVFVLTMQNGENRLTKPFLSAFNAALDTVEK